MILEAFQPNPKGWPIRLSTYTSAIAATGNRNTSVCDKNGSARYPKCVMYQYQAKPAAYKVLLTTREKNDFPSTSGNKKNCTPSITVLAIGFE